MAHFVCIYGSCAAGCVAFYSVERRRQLGLLRQLLHWIASYGDRLRQFHRNLPGHLLHMAHVLAHYLHITISLLFLHVKKKSCQLWSITDIGVLAMMDKSKSAQEDTIFKEKWGTFTQ